MLGERERGGAGHEQPGGGEGTCRARVGLGGVGEPAVHGRHPEDERRAPLERRHDRRRREPARVDDAAAAAQRPEDPEHEPVDVEERQRLDEHVAAVPAPRVRERIEVRRDRSSWQLDALRRSRCPGRVDDQRGSLVVARRAVAVGRSGGARRHPRQRRERGGQHRVPRGDDEVGPAVGDHVGELALARRRVHRHDCDPGGERPDDGDDRVQRRRRVDGDAVGAGDPRRDPTGCARQLVVAEALAGDRDRRPRLARGELRQQHPAQRRRRPVSRSAIAARLPGGAPGNRRARAPVRRSTAPRDVCSRPGGRPAGSPGAARTGRRPDSVILAHVDAVTRLGVAELLREYGARRLSPVEVLDACRRAASRRSTALVGGFTALCLERAREEARRGRGGVGAGRGARRSRGSRSASRTCSTRRACAPRTARRCSTTHVPARDAEAVAPGARGGRDPRRQDADARVRVGDHVRQRAAGLGAQPVGARARLRRLERRLGGRARGGRGAAGARQRHRRLDPRAGRVLRRRRPEADLRPDQRAPAPGRSPARSTIPGRWRRRPRTRRCCSRRSPASTTPIPSTVDVPLGDVRGELGRGLGGLVVGALPRPRSSSRSPPTSATSTTRRCARCEAPARASSRCALPEAELDPPGLPDDPERRGARHAPARRASTRRGATSTAPTCSAGSSAAERGDARAVPRTRAADRERVRAALRAPLPVVRRAPHAGQRGLAAADRRGDGRARGRRADVPRSRDELHDAAGSRRPARRAPCAPGSTRSGSRSACSSRRRPGRRRRVLRAAQGLFEATPEVQSRRPAL